jgi:hypothetical protein
VIGQSQAEAAQTLQAGFVLGRVSTVVDITCEYLGEVKSQSPAARTLDPPGTAVAVAIGREEALSSASRMNRRAWPLGVAGAGAG